MTDLNYSLPRWTVLRSPKFAYTLESVLGQGGFGITYLATAEVMVENIPQEYRFAIKEHFISQMCVRNADTQRVEIFGPVTDVVNKSRRDFITEANRLGRLGIDHPNIVRINEVFEANNTAYYVMEYLGDENLQRYVASRGCLSKGETHALIGPVIEAVAMLHDNHVAHYDIKPGNIMLQARRGHLRPVLIDFGLAKHYDADGNATSTLGNGGFSAGYAPIEQTQGISKFSPKCDVYALAATIYYCLTGKRPPAAQDVRQNVLMADLQAVTDTATARAVVRGMAIFEEDRTPDCRTLAREVFGDTADKTVVADTPEPRIKEEEIIPEVVDDTPTPKADPKTYLPPKPTPRPRRNPNIPTPQPVSKPWYRKKSLWISLALFLCLGAGIVWYASRNDTNQTESAYFANQTEIQDTLSSGSINGHDYVDLGLPSGLKWATCNIGASGPSDCGDYFAWGETTPKNFYTEDNSLTYGKSLSELRDAGIIDSNNSLTRAYDAACQNWGSSWRMPTRADFQELLDYCDWEWTNYHGTSGYQITGPNGNTIFLPAAGYRDESTLGYEGSYGRYWSSTAYDGADGAYSLHFYEGYHNMDWSYRNYGRSVRPVGE